MTANDSIVEVLGRLISSAEERDDVELAEAAHRAVFALSLDVVQEKANMHQMMIEKAQKRIC